MTIEQEPPLRDAPETRTAPWKQLFPWSTDELPVDDTLAALRRLVEVLRRAGFSRTASVPRPGKLRHLPLDLANLTQAFKNGNNLFHSTAMPWLYQTLVNRSHPVAMRLHRLFHLCLPAPPRTIDSIISETLLSELLKLGILVDTERGICSQIMITPYGEQLFLSDPTESKSRDDFVYMGRISFAVPDAVALTASTSEQPEQGRLLDLGCGSGILSISLANRFEEVVGVDINDRCVEYAELNAALAGTDNCQFANSDLYSQVNGTFDVIATNPPCAWAMNEGEDSIARHGGGEYGSGIPSRILAGAFDYLRPEGVVYCAVSCPIIQGRPYVLDLMQRSYDKLGAEIRIFPVFDEFDYARRKHYRRHDISTIVRYLAIVRPSTRPSISFGRIDSLRAFSYRIRTALPKLLARVNRGQS